MARAHRAELKKRRSRLSRARRSATLAATLCAAVWGAAACGSSDGGESGAAAQVRCASGATLACKGPGDCDGEQRCRTDRSGFDECVCPIDTSSEAGAGGAAAVPGASGASGAGGMGVTGAVGGAGGAGGAGGGDGGASGAGGACTATCDPSEPPVCDAGARKVCIEFVPQCAEPTTIACPSGFCADEQSCGTCPAQCQKDGDAGCAKGALRQCAKDARGCLAWGAANQACASGFCAADGQSCGACVDECPTAGATECKNGLIRGCAEDVYGCRRWWFSSACVLGSCADAKLCLPGYSEGQRGSPLDDEPLALAIDRQGALVMVGGYHVFDLDTGSRPKFDAHLYAVGPDGRLQVFESWGSKDEPDEAVAVAIASDNSYVVVGYTDGAIGTVPSHGGRDAFLSKWSPEQPMKPATLLYSRQWGSVATEAAASVALDRDDTAYVFGSTLGELEAGASVGAQDLFLTRWDSVGNFLGTSQWGTPALDQAASVLIDPADSVLVAGSTQGAFPNSTNAGLGDAFVSRLNADGSLAWTTQFGTSGNESVAQMIFDRQGNLLVLGTTNGVFAGNTSAGGTDVFVSKLDPAGKLLFTRQWGTAKNDTAASLAQAPSGKIYAAVTVEDVAANYALGQTLLLTWNETATQADPRLFDTCAADRATAITVDPSGTVYMAGSTQGSFVDTTSRGGSDILLVKSQITN
ncbi:MAG TPA: SBBP repeat-containing protein [Polyangiaceae bacterium]|nr:SBBP repeat-containing protein [Polyangiaceae bacterium]